MEKAPVPSIQFIREGDKSHSSKKTKSLLQEAQSWEMRMDLGRKLFSPGHSNIPKARGGNRV